MIIDLTTGTHNNVPYWQQERLVIKLTTASDHVDLYDWADQNTPLATYLTADGVAEIDITDYVRANPTRNTYALTYEGAGEYWPISIVRAGLINPEGMIIPPTDGIDSQLGMLIIPPSKIIRAAAGFDSYGFEFYAKQIQGITWQYRMNSGAWQALSNGVTMAVRSDLNTLQIRFNSTLQLSRTITERECGHRYADISWVSAIGMDRTLNGRKLHAWEVRAQEIASAGDYSLLDWDNKFDIVKGREDSFTLVLDELDAYDMWYYSDILTSSDVRLLAIDGWTAQSESEMVRLEVVGKSVTLPNGTALGKLEIQVKFKRYDAVSL